MDKHKIASYWSLYILTAGVMLFVYIHNIPPIPTLFELPDETGYLWNTAWFLGIDWNSIGKNGFYGYGYSIFLIPLFKLSDSGIALIKGAYIINILFVIGIYIIFCILLGCLWKKHSIWIPIISAISCLTPYLVTNACKVLCENCLSFFCSLLILLFYKTIDTGKVRYYIGLAAVAAFIPTIHTRGIVFSGVCLIFILLDFVFNNKVSKKQILIAFSVFGVVYAVFYLIKMDNLNYRQLIRTSNGLEELTNNLITSNWLKARFFQVFNVGIFNYLGSFISRIFYAIRSTGGLIAFGILYLICVIKKGGIFGRKKRSLASEKEYAENITILLVMINFFCSIIASTFNSIGYNFQYLYYGRYYEHTIPIMLCISFYLVSNKQGVATRKKSLEAVIIIISSGLISFFWANSYLKEIQISVDTARTAAFSSTIVKCTNFTDVICYSCLISTIVVLIGIASHRNLLRNILMTIGILFILCDMDKTCIETVKNVAIRSIKDYEICNYLLENVSEEKIYILDDHTYKYEGVIQKNQVFLKNYSINEISCIDNDETVLEPIENGDYIIAYSTNKFNFKNKQDYIEVMKGKIFILYQKTNVDYM